MAVQPGAPSQIWQVILTLEHKVLPTTINVEEPPELRDHTAVQYSSISINTRRDGVSSFGFGGSSYHCIVKKFEQQHETPCAAPRAAALPPTHLRSPPRLTPHAHGQIAHLLSRLCPVRRGHLRPVPMSARATWAVRRFRVHAVLDVILLSAPNAVSLLNMCETSHAEISAAVAKAAGSDDKSSVSQEAKELGHLYHKFTKASVLRAYLPTTHARVDSAST